MAISFTEFLPVLLILGAVLAFRAFRRNVGDARNSAVEALSMSVKFDFSYTDGLGISTMPFALFRLGEGHTAQRIISGTHNGLPLQIFDYEYYVDGRSRTYHRFTCAILTIPAACPGLSITHETTLQRLEDHLSHDDVKFEYDAFNNRFHVVCPNTKFAFSLLDGQMMDWLLGADAFHSVEVVGPWVLIAQPTLDPERWLDLGMWLDAFHSHIPEIVYTAFPAQ